LAVCIGGGYLLNGIPLVARPVGLRSGEAPDADVDGVVPLRRWPARHDRADHCRGGRSGRDGVHHRRLLTVLGDEDQSAVVAGALVYRSLNSALPLVTGAIAF